MSKKLKSVGSVFMAICLAVTMSSTSLFAVVADAIENSTEEVTQEKSKDSSNEQAQEDKTSNDVSSEESSSLGWYDAEKTSFTISSEDDLVLLSKIVNGTAEDAGGNKVQDSFKGKTIKLNANLDLKGVDIAPIGTSANQFEGTFNGNDKSIKLNISSEEGNQALFAYNNGIIKNLEITGSVSGKEYVAGLVANNTGTIKNINSSVTVTATNDYAGGIVAKNDGTIERCNNTGNVSSYRFTGGIVAINSYNVIKCTNSATITCTGKDTSYNSCKGTAGITGVSKGTQAKPFKISDCYNSGKIIAGYTGGGITGWVQNGQVINCYNTGNCEGAWNVGGIAGGVMEYSSSDYSVVENCYNYGNIRIAKDVTNNAGAGGRYEFQYAGGIAGFMQSGHVLNCYNAGEAYAVMQAGGICGGNYNGTATVIKNCQTTKKGSGSSYIGDVVGWWNSSASDQCTGNKYYEANDENCAAIVAKLNAQVTDKNGYYGWKYEDGEISQARVYDVNFKVNPEDAKVVVKNSEGTTLSAVEDNLYMLPNGDYTCEISKDGYKTKTRSFSVKNADDSFVIKLASNDALWDGNEDTSWYNAEKTTFEISSNSELAGLSKLVYEGNNFEGKTIKLSKDLNLNDKDWAGIGTSENQFMGTFDGAGYSISNVKSSVFKYIGSKGKVVNLGILESGALADTNAGIVANCYNISNSSLVLNNSNSVTNCYTSTNNAVVKAGKEAVDSYYVDGTTYTKKDLSNNKIANLLNKNVTLANKGYMNWNVVDKDTVHEKSYIAKFNVKSNSGEINNAKITLYDKEGNEINKESSKNFMLEDGTFRLINGQYKYKIAADRYAVKTGSLKVSNENVTIDETLVDAYQVLFNITPNDAELTVKDSKGNVIEASEGTKYFLIDGKYTYEVKKTGYEAQTAQFEVKGGDLNFDVNLQNVYKVSFVSNISNARDFKVEVYKDGKLIEAEEDGSYLLTNGKYTYKASATGYAQIDKEFEVSSNELAITVEFETSYDTSWYDSTKTSFEISNAKQLAGLGAIVNGYTNISDNFSGKTITITSDINVDKVLSEWLPIGTSQKKFAGIFDGQNHTITLNINQPDTEYVGLFSILTSSTQVKNVIVDGTITGKDHVAGIAGYGDWYRALENCVNKATITGEKYVGGILGDQGTYQVYTNNCANKGKVTGKEAVGGICGYLRQAYISNCYNEGEVTGETSVGGIGGLGVSTCYLMNCYNTGTITGTKSDTGGIVGNANYSYVTNMYNTGTVIGVDYVGGIAGKGSTNGINNSYNTGDIKASGNYVGGVVGITGNSGASKVSNCYNTGSVTPSETSTNVGVVAGAGNIENCYYINTFTNYTDNQGEAFTQEDFENGNLAKKLNDNLSLGYKIWGVKDKTTTFTDNSIQKSFDVYNQSNNNKIKDYTIELKDSEGNVVKPYNEGSYVYSNLKLNEKYTYTVTAKTFKTATGTFTYNGNNEETRVGLSYIQTTTTIKTNVENAKITLTRGYNSYTPGSDGTYSLSPGTYNYKVLAEGYPMTTGIFTIDIVEEDVPKTINIELTKGYNVEFTSDSTTDQKVEVKDSSNKTIESATPNKYNLVPGKYTYTLKADGYKTVTGEFEVVDKDLETISIKLEKVFNLDWYDKDKTEYTLNTKEDLLGFFAILCYDTTSVSREDFSGKTVKLGNDIELNSEDKFVKNDDGTITVSDDIYTFEYNASFNGTFDGNNKSIKGLYRTRGALFNYNYGTIKDLTVTGYIKGSSIAGICTYNYKTIDNCTNKVILVTDNYGGAGGISYQVSNGTISNCTNDADITGGKNIGGITYNANNATLKNNINKGDIIASTTNASNMAGIVANISTKTNVDNNYNLGSISGSSRVAGIVGNIAISTYDKTQKGVRNNVNYGKIEGAEETSGAIIGFATGEDVSQVDISNNFYKKGTFAGAVMGKDIEDKAIVKTSKELADGSVATLLNSAVTDENGYKSWTVEDSKTVFGSCALSISASVKGATIKLYDYKGNEIKAIPGTNGSYDGLKKGSLYKYEVTKEGLNTETGTVIIGNSAQTIYVELSATVYVTVSKDGEFKLADDNDTKLTRIPVTTTNFDVTDYGYPSVYNNDNYPTLLNVFIRFHELYAGGADNFLGKPNNDPAKGNDLFITKFLGIETTQLNYYVNNKYPGEWLEDKGYIWGSTVDYIEMKNNDDVNVTMFTNYQTPMFYTYFDKQEATVKQGQDLELTLKGFDNSDAYTNPEAKNISGSTIYIDGEETKIVTDKYGKATLTFDEAGTYIISAQGTDLSLSDSEKTVITAPVCEVTVKEDNDITVSFDADNGSEVVTKAMKPGKVLNYMPTEPTKEGYTFVGWYKDTDDITTEYKQGSRFTQSITYKAKYAHVTMLGAQGKMVSNGKSGIRFGTKIYNDGDEIVEKGTVILPANLLAEGEALTLNTPNVAKSVANTLYEANKEQNYVTYLGTIVNIPKAQFERQITASAYVIYKDKAGHEYAVYAPYSKGSVSVLDLLGNDIDWGEDW